MIGGRLRIVVEIGGKRFPGLPALTGEYPDIVADRIRDVRHAVPASKVSEISITLLGVSNLQTLDSEER
jgi:hypothetical protein